MRADSGFYNHAVVAVCRAAGCPLLNHDSPAAERAHADRGDPGRGLDADPVLAAGRRRCRRDDLHARSSTGRMRPGAAHRAAREAAPGSQLALFTATATTPSSATARGSCWSWRPPSPPRRGRERDPRPQVRRRAEPSPLGPLHRERGVARGAGDRAQPRPLDGAAGARRGNRDDQDAPAALLRSRGTAHPFCPALDAAPPKALAVGRPVGSRPGAVTGDTAPRLTPAHSAGPGPRLAPACPRTPRAPSRPRPQRPRAALSDGSSLRLAPGAARRTPARPPNSPPARPPAPSSFDRWIRA